MTTTKGPPDLSEQAVAPARPAPPMEKDRVLIGLVVAAISLIVALIGLGAMGFFQLDSRIDSLDGRIDSFDSRIDSFDSRIDSLDSRIDSLDSRIDAQGAELRAAIGAQGTELRAAIDAQGAELREGFKHMDQRIDGLYDLLAQGRR